MDDFVSRLFERVIFGRSPGWTLALLKWIPEEKLVGLAQSVLFKQTISYAYERSKFYRRLFDQHGIDPHKVARPSDLKNLFTTGEDIRNHPYEDFLCAKPITAFETTGTTSPVPKRVLYSAWELRKYGKVGATGLWRMGIRPEDRVASAFDYSFWISGPTLKASLEWLGAFHLEAGKIDPADFYRHVKPYHCNVLVGDPSWLLRLSEVAEKEGPWPVKLILAGGENMTERTRVYIESVWKTDVLLSYGQTEGFGNLGIECRQKDGYHLNDFMFCFEIVNPDSEGYGEIVYTTFNRNCMPLIRYRSGDISRLIPEPCLCGFATSKIAKLRGRVDEMIACGMGNISPWMFDQIFGRVSLASEDWQVAVLRPGNKDVLEIRMEADETQHSEIQNSVLKVLQHDFSDYWKSYEMGLFEITFRFFGKGQLRTGRKLKRLVDERSELVRHFELARA